MQIIQVKEPEGQGQWGTPDELEPDADLGIEIFIYWYVAGDYEGSGLALVGYSDDTWSWWYLNHCSCYGPMEQEEENVKYDSLEKALSQEATEEFLEDSAAIRKEARRFNRDLIHELLDYDS
jgi:hypothetical protein